MKKNQNVDDLIQGIESILSKDCCPLTDDEQVLLKNAIAELRGKNRDKVNVEEIAKWVLLFFKTGCNFADLFS